MLSYPTRYAQAWIALLGKAVQVEGVWTVGEMHVQIVADEHTVLGLEVGGRPDVYWMNSDLTLACEQEGFEVLPGWGQGVPEDEKITYFGTDLDAALGAMREYPPADDGEMS